MRENVFVKVSGDLIRRQDVLLWIKEKTGRCHLIICVGGGSDINEEFKEKGFTVYYGPLGRETKHLIELQTARDILEENQALVQDLLADYNIYAEVILPFIYLGTLLCPVNGDEMVRLAYIRCMRLFVLTEEGERLKEKKEKFAGLDKIEVIGFPRLP